MFNECLIVTQNRPEIGWEIKNILRIYKAGLAGNVKNTEPRPKFPYSYKKKSVYINKMTLGSRLRPMGVK